MAMGLRAGGGPGLGWAASVLSRSALQSAFIQGLPVLVSTRVPQAGLLLPNPLHPSACLSDGGRAKK